MEIKNNKRIINSRPIFLVFIGLIFGIFGMAKFIQYKLNGQFNFAILFGCLILSIFIAWLVLYYIKIDNLFFAVIKRDFKYLVVFIVALCVGILGSYISLNPYMNYHEYENYECTIEAKIEKVYNYSLLLEDIKIINSDNSVVTLESGGYLNISSTTRFDEGDKISVLCKLSKKNVNIENISSYLNNNAYSITVSGTSSIEIIGKYKGDIASSIRLYVKNILFDNMNEDNAGVCFAMLFGKKSFVKEEISDAFSASGISHILAVSGLHVGVLVSAIYFVLKKIFRSNKWLKIVILGLFLLAYSYICDFTPSVVRASIMSIVLMISSEFGYRYDGLNSLSLAGVIILLFSPLSLFDVGFQLSFLCVFAIISMSPFVTKLLLKIKCPQVLASGLAISISTNIVILPVCVNMFNKVSIISVIANIIVIPLFSFCFILLFACILIVSILKFMSFILIVPETVLHGLKVVANFFASIPNAYMVLFNVSYLVLFGVVLLSFFIHFLMINKKFKAVLCSGLMALMIVLIVVANLPLYSAKDMLIFKEFSSNNSCIYVSDNREVNLIGFNKSNYYMDNFMLKNKVKSIKVLYAYNFKFDQLTSLETFAQEYKIENIILPTYFKQYESALNKLNIHSNLRFADEVSSIGKFNVREYNTSLDKCIAIELYNEEKNILFTNSLSEENISYLTSEIDGNIDIMFTPSYKQDFRDFNIDVAQIVCNSSSIKDKNINNLFYLENFTIAL